MSEISQRDLASTLGLTTQQIRNLEDRGLPHRAEGRRKLYPVPEAVQWYVEFKKEQALSRAGSADFEEAKARREQARARLAELEVAKAEGELIPREVVEAVYGDRMLDVLRSAILNMPGRWGGQITGLDTPREGEAALDRISRDLLEHLSGDSADALEGTAGLPDDLPGREALLEAGVETMDDLLGVDDLTTLPGIGKATERRIREYLEGRDAA